MRTDRAGAAKSGDLLSDAMIGAAAGALGVWVLDRLDWFMWKRESAETRRRTSAVRPGGEPPAHALVSRVERAIGADGSGAARVARKIEHLETDGLARDSHYAAGAVAHYGIGIVPAAIYGVVQDRIRLPGPARGALYGLSLFVVQDEVLNAASGLSARPREYPWQAHARGLIQHVAYGLVTDAAITVMKRQLRSRLSGQASSGANAPTAAAVSH